MDNFRKKQVIIAMSGGVDSSVAVWLLKKQGFEVVGVFLNLGQVQHKESLAAARKVAQKIGIPLKVIDLKKKFRKEVIDYFLKSYQQGLTPNPCVVCNQKIKFNTLLKLANKLGFDYIATGHYVRLWRKSQIPSSKSQTNPPPTGDLPKGDKLQIQNSKQKKLEVVSYGLTVARDRVKDQSYFLYTLGQKQLAKILFPLGDYTKEEVRKLADKAKLPYLKKESQDICFLFCETAEFLKQNLKLKPGPIVTSEGKTVGTHEGLALYTIGQRKAIKIGGIGPFYVAGRDFKKNQLIVTDKFDDSVLYSDKLLAGQVNWLADEIPKLPLPPHPESLIFQGGDEGCEKSEKNKFLRKVPSFMTGCGGLRCQARVRYQQTLADCLVSKKGKNYLVKFSQKLRAITPGQSVVFYKSNEVLGGGVIKS